MEGGGENGRCACSVRAEQSVRAPCCPDKRRLDYGAQQVTPLETPLPSDFDALVEDIENKRWKELLAVDQLKKEMREKRAFLGFQVRRRPPPHLDERVGQRNTTCWARLACVGLWRVCAHRRRTSTSRPRSRWSGARASSTRCSARRRGATACSSAPTSPSSRCDGRAGARDARPRKHPTIEFEAQRAHPSRRNTRRCGRSTTFARPRFPRATTSPWAPSSACPPSGSARSARPRPATSERAAADARRAVRRSNATPIAPIAPIDRAIDRAHRVPHRPSPIA